MYQLIGRQGCRETRKAERFMQERNIEFQFLDLDKRALSSGELRNIFDSIPPEDLIDRNTREFEKRGLKYMEFDPAEELVSDQKLIVTPVLRFKNRAIAGFDETAYKNFLLPPSTAENEKKITAGKK